MRLSTFCGSFLLAALLVAGGAHSDESRTHGDSASQLVATLQSALESAGADTVPESDAVNRLESAIRSVLEQTPAQSPVAVQLSRALEQDGSTQTRLARLQTATRATVDQLAFQPVHEAEQPQGFPPHTPAGLLEVKEYPAYRMAVANGFWTLFMHIKANNIEMTAPVEMTFNSPDGKTLKQSSMAFLYGRPDLGSAGQKGKVDVIDVPPATVISLGIRGRRTQEKVDRAQATIEDWLEAHPDYARAGDFRIMGYNSPYVPDERQFWEAQLIIRKRDDGQ
ncbi:heme-binding protein [Maioricimonas sp. JC845]|uniref:heme-binding protein n=1 Tax=Maioricimonas sp. JC845 TaxID=3232138 RepID=UPI003459B4A5